MSKINSVAQAIKKKLQKQSLDRTKATVEILLSQYNCLHLRGSFMNSVLRHSVASDLQLNERSCCSI